VRQLIPHFIQEQFDQRSLHNSLQAYVMFVDLSGFTPLTEALMGKGSRGAEELSIILKDIFEPLVEVVYTHGGFIPYYAGDAFTAIFPQADDLDLGVFMHGALSVRDLFKQRSYKFGAFQIGVKIGLSYGTVEWGIVGRYHRAFYFRGDPVDEAALCQDLAKNHASSIALGKKLLKLLPPDLEVIPVNEDFFCLGPQVKAQEVRLPVRVIPALRREVMELFLPAEVLDYSQVGEFRTVISVFIAFEGVPNHALLNKFAGVVLEQINNFSGYFKEIDFGDKGGVMTCFFGAPVSFENNIDRALEFIHALNQELYELRAQYGVQFKAAATEGTAYTGLIGGRERLQYAVVGNRVNLAARIMSYADWEEVLVDGEIQKNRNFNFQHRGDIRYKGIKGDIPTYILMGRNESRQQVYSENMVGRDAEMFRLLDFSNPLLEGQPTGVAYIFGEAGIGKSRLCYELKNTLLRDQKAQWHTCPADQILRKPFNPFVYFLKNYFDQSLEKNTSRNLQRFEARFQQLLDKLQSVPDAQALRDDLIRTKSVLAAQVGIMYFDSLWEQLDARGRYQNTIQSIIDLLLAESLIRPLVIELEDAHWIDENSQELLFELVRHLKRHPIFLLITSRYGDEGQKPQLLDPLLLEAQQVRGPLEIDLNVLQPEAVRQFAELKLQGSISEAFFVLLQRAANSNPFYLEQLLEYFSEQNLLQQSNGLWNLKDENIQLSSSINSILTARIDRLSSLVKETVKAAAVIGREFEVPVLTEVMKYNEEFSRTGPDTELLTEQIGVAERVQIWRAMNELRYIFRHSLLREAAYSMQLRARLQQLHRLIAEAIERLYGDHIDERFVDLAFHYEQAGVFDKTCSYLRRAGDYARRNFQNQQALDLYEKLLHLLGSEQDIASQIKTLLKKGKIQELIGKWEDCEDTYKRALDLAKQHRDVILLGRANNSMGRVVMLRGDYTEAMRYYQKSVSLFESVEDKFGFAEVYGNLGNLYFRQGKYEEAKKYFQDSLSIGQEIRGYVVDSQIVANLGLTYMNQGNYDEGIRQQQEQLAYCQAHNDKPGMATIHTYIGIVLQEKGDYEEALFHFQAGLDLATELGNKHLTAVGIGNIGLIYERQGKYNEAMELYVKDLELTEELGDKQGESIALGFIGQLLNIQGDFHRAIEYMQKALMLCEELGYQKGLAKAVNTLGDIFYNLQQYPRSLHFYNRAIDITRTIGNKLVLGLSLAEKGTVLLETGNHKELDKVTAEAQQLAIDLDHPDLYFEGGLLNAKRLHLYGQKEAAEQELHTIFQRKLSPDQAAAAHYELHRLHPEDRALTEKTLAMYDGLVAQTPKFIYQSRKKGLEQNLQE
jgi:predicted ATPase/class 3 adenylate cyclase